MSQPAAAIRYGIVMLVLAMASADASLPGGHRPAAIERVLQPTILGASGVIDAV
jgi:hypothetical protein